MPLNWTPFAIPGLLVLIFGLWLAWFIYTARPDRTQNRRLALQLLLEAPVVAILSGAVWMFDSAPVVKALTLVANVLVWPKLWTYYSFLATLDTPLARPLRSRRRLNLLLLATLLAALTVVLRPEWYMGDVFFWPPVGALSVAPGTAFVPIFWMWGLMWLVGLSFSISALRNARTEMGRERGRAYLIAFGTRDISFLLVVAFLTFVPPDHPRFHWVFVVFPTIWLVYFPLVAYGILKHQLFDIDLRLKTTAERSTVLAGLTGVFFLGSEAFEQFIPADGFALGILAAAVVAAAFLPLKRLTERLMDGVMPGVSPTPEYLTERKYQVYRDAIEGALQDGSVSQRERAILASLQQSLGIDPVVADRIEAKAQATFARAPTPTATAIG